MDLFSHLKDRQKWLKILLQVCYFFTCMSIYWRYCRIMLPWWFQHKTVFQKLPTSSYTICTCISFNMTFNFISMLIDINYSLLSRQGQNCIVLRFTSSNEITTRVCKLTSDKWQDVLYINSSNKICQLHVAGHWFPTGIQP